MPRQDNGYSQHRRLLSEMDTDLQAPALESPPSPPLHAQTDHSNASDEDGDSNRHDDNPPETPYYDYACTFPFGCALTVQTRRISSMSSRNSTLSRRRTGAICRRVRLLQRCPGLISPRDQARVNI